MKRIFIFIHIFLLCLLVACDSENITLPSENNKLVGNIISRSNDKEALPEGSKILLNAYGGLTIKDEIFTNNNGTWTNNNGLEWKKVEETTYITALYPHDISNLYYEGALKDVLIAQDTLTQGEKDVTLTFRHLFASFILNVDETLVDKIKSIQLTSPQRVESISPVTGGITLSDIATPTILQGNGSNSYAFIIPPMEASITLNITLDNEISQSYKLQRHNFKSGFIYECGLRDWNTVPGIRSADDLKTFSQLINEGKEAPAYGEKQDDGRMLYRLLADIDLKGVNLTPIGHNQDKPFDDIFDGGGYTISNYTASPYNGFVGLFGLIGTKGTIKNLHLFKNETPTISSGANYGAGIICGRCKGIISNCSVSKSTITTTQSTNTGGIAGTLITGGTIMNCSVTNSKFTSSTGPVGAIVGKIENDGYIYNSYSAIDTIQNMPNSKNARGGIVGSINNGVIQNCYVYNLTFDSRSENKGQITGRAINSIINHYYYDQDFTRVNNNSDCTTIPNYKYNKSVVIYTLLNQWIGDRYIFTQWKEDPTGTLPAIFQ